MNSPQTALSPWRIRCGERATSPGAPPSPGATGLPEPVAAPSPALPPSAAGEGAAETRRVVAATPAPGATATTPTGRLSPGSAAGSSARGMGVVAPQTPTPGGLGVGRPTDMDTHGDGGPISVGPNSSRAGACSAATYDGVIEVLLPVSPHTEARRARVAEYQRFTRKEGLTRKAACRRLGLSMGTVQNYEREITGLTGTQRRQRLQARHAELLAQGLSHVEIARRLGVHRKTSMAWARLGEAP